MKPYLTYPGSKNGSGVYQTIINEIPPHIVYIEAFLGNGAILSLKKPAKTSIAIDANKKIIEDWQNICKDKSIKFIANDAISYLNQLLIGEAFKDICDKVFIYCDPPYIIHSRKCQRPIYENEMTDKEHEFFLKVILNLPFKIAVSCYPNDMYEHYLHDWRKITFSSQTRKHTATEVLYMNYPVPTELHDYSFIGNDFRERERIRQKIKRHVNGLMRLPVLERKAILEAITGSNIKNNVTSRKQN